MRQPPITALSSLLMLISWSSVVEPAAAQTLQADYQFEEELTSSVGTPPELTRLGIGNIFAGEDVQGETRTVLRFNQGDGLELFPTSDIIPGDRYSVAVLFRLENVDGFRRVLGFDDGVSEYGVYVVDNAPVFFPFRAPSPRVIPANEYVHAVLTRAADGNVVLYVNGTPRVWFTDDLGWTFLTPIDTLRFFQDNTVGDFTEAHSAGAVARIQLYDDALSPEEVRELAGLSFPSPAVGVLNDRRGDTALVLGAGAGPSPDLLSLGARFSDDELILNLELAERFTLRGTDPEGGLVALIYLDTDQDVSTHSPFGILEALCPDFVPGRDFLLNLGAPSQENRPAEVLVHSLDNTPPDPPEFVGVATLERTATTLTIAVPLPLLGGDDGRVDVFAGVGSINELITDCTDLRVRSVAERPMFRRGDCNDDGGINISDAVSGLRHCFGGVSVPCAAACDADGDGNPCSGVTDGVRILTYLFRGGEAPPPPFPDCGPAREGEPEADCETPPASCQ